MFDANNVIVKRGLRFRKNKTIFINLTKKWQKKQEIL